MMKNSVTRKREKLFLKSHVYISGALVYVLHRPAAEVWIVERVQRSHQAEHVQRHHLSEPDVNNTTHQLQQLQTGDEQQGLDLQ